MSDDTWSKAIRAHREGDFQSAEQLRKHEEFSDLHAKNLKAQQAAGTAAHFSEYHLQKQVLVFGRFVRIFPTKFLHLYLQTRLAG